MSDCGGSTDLVNVNLMFNDAAAANLPDSDPIVSGVYKPTNFGTGDTFLYQGELTYNVSKTLGKNIAIEFIEKSGLGIN